MGQRMVCTVKKNQEDICKLYYHWSAYTVSALMETRDIIQWIDECEDDDLVLHLIRCAEQNGGGIQNGVDGNEWNYISRLYPDCAFKCEPINRNNGLIAVSEEGMAEMQRWSEGDVEIDIDSRTVNFTVFGGYDSLEEYETERMDWDEDYEKQNLDDIYNIGFNLGCFDFDDIEDVIAAVEDEDFIVRNGNEIYEMIS